MSVSGSRLDDSAGSAVMFASGSRTGVSPVDSAQVLLFVRHAVVRTVPRISNRSEPSRHPQWVIGAFRPVWHRLGALVSRPGSWLSAPTSNP